MRLHSPNRKRPGLRCSPPRFTSATLVVTLHIARNALALRAAGFAGREGFGVVRAVRVLRVLVAVLLAALEGAGGAVLGIHVVMGGMGMMVLAVLLVLHVLHLFFLGFDFFFTCFGNLPELSKWCILVQLCPKWAFRKARWAWDFAGMAWAP